MLITSGKRDAKETETDAAEKITPKQY